jgi:hypothetical protein
MTVSRFILLYLWIAPHALQAVLAIMMIQRKMLREFPVFFAYTVFEITQFLVLFVSDHWDRVSAEQYTVLWLTGGIVSIALRFGVVHEIFTIVFRSYPGLQEFGGILFRWGTVILMMVAVTLVGYSSGAEMDRLTVALIIVDRAVSIIQCGLLVLLILLVRLLSFPWTSYAFGIAVGLGFYASSELAVSAIRAHVGITPSQVVFDDISMGAYHFCVVFWIVALLLPQRKPSRTTPAPIQDLEHWNNALQRLLHQ